MMKFLSVDDIIKRYDTLKGERTNWERLWQEIADLMLPRKNSILVKRTEGEDKNFNIYDNTAMQSLELLAAALHSFLTNSDEEWFEMSTGDADLDQRDDVRKWLQKTVTQMHMIINNSNFQTEIHELYLDLVGFGTSPMAIEEDDDLVVRFGTRFLGDVVIAENNRGVVDELYIEFEWTARKLVQEYGYDVLGRDVQAAFDKNTDQKFKLLQAVYPKDYEANSGSVFKYISEHILRSGKISLRKKGFSEFPFVVPRFSKAPGETYGRSPGMTALPEAKVLNVMVETTLEGAQKVVDPPLQAPDDGYIAQVNSYPGGISYYRAGSQDRIMPIFNDARIDFGFQAIQQSQAKIRDSFYINQLQLGNGPQMTATEVVQRTEEKMRLLGPMLGRMQVELLRPMIERIFAIMMRRRLLTTIPVALSGKKLQVRYSSFIAKTQRSGKAQDILKTMQAAAPFIQADPTILDVIDGDQSMRTLAKIYGFPQEMLRDQKVIAQLRQQRQQQQQQQMQQQQQAQQAETMANAAGGIAQATKTQGV